MNVKTGRNFILDSIEYTDQPKNTLLLFLQDWEYNSELKKQQGT